MGNFLMKKYIAIFLLLLANTAFANTWVIFNEESGINYYDQSSLDMHAFDRTVKVLNNAPKAEDGVASTTSTVQIDCRLGTVQVLSWQEFSVKMANRIFEIVFPCLFPHLHSCLQKSTNSHINL